MELHGPSKCEQQQPKEGPNGLCKIRLQPDTTTSLDVRQLLTARVNLFLSDNFQVHHAITRANAESDVAIDQSSSSSRQ